MKTKYSYVKKMKVLEYMLLLFLLFLVIAQPLLAQAPVNIIWDRTYGANNNDGLTDQIRTADGGYLLGGYSYSGINGDKTEVKGFFDFWIIKLNADGSKAWDRTFGGTNGDNLTSLIQTSDGGYLLGGISGSNIGGDKTENSRGVSDYWVVKLNANGSKVWDRTFGGNWLDELTTITQTTDGGYLLGGSSSSGANGDKTQPSRGVTDYWVVKLNADGSKAWDRTLGGDDNDYLNSSIQTSDGGYLLGGGSVSKAGGDKTANSLGGFDYWVVKLNADGSKAWDRTFGGIAYDMLTTLIQTANGGYLLGGYSNSEESGNKSEDGRGNYDYWVVMLNADGSKVWDKTFGGKSSDELTSLIETFDGYLLGGYSHSGNGGDKTEASRGGIDYWVVKLNADGSKAWDKGLGGTGDDELFSLILTIDNGYLLGGRSKSGIEGDKTEVTRGGYDYWIVKLKETGPLSVTPVQYETGIHAIVYPNPTRDEINLFINGLEAKSISAQLTLYNSIGQPVLQQVNSINQLQSGLKLSMSNFSKGIYHLLLQTKGEVITKRIIFK